MVGFSVFVGEDLGKKLTHMEELLMALTAQEQQRFDSINAHITKLGSDIPAALGSLQQSADALADQIADLQTQVSSLTTSNSDDEAKIADLTQQIADLQEAAEAHSADVDTALDAVDTALGGLDEGVPEQAAPTTDTASNAAASSDTTGSTAVDPSATDAGVAEGEFKAPDAPAQPVVTPDQTVTDENAAPVAVGEVPTDGATDDSI
jgi:ABC-type transporter Mla subunit MlaD